MKFFVTGSNGFVGRELVRRLIENGFGVVEFSRKFGDDLSDLKQLERKMNGCDAVVHLAALIDNAPWEDLKKVNVDFTRNVLLAAEKNKVKKFVFLSSVSVHGNFNGIIDENSPVNALDNSYGKSKFEAESLAREFSKKFDVIILRPPFVLGANDLFKRIVLVVSRGLPLFGGKQSMQFVYVKNLADAIIFVAGKNVSNEVFVVCQQDKISVKEVYETIFSALEKKQGCLKLPRVFSKMWIYCAGFKIKFFHKSLGMDLMAIDRLSVERKYSCKKLSSIGWKQKFSCKEALLDAMRQLQ